MGTDFYHPEKGMDDQRNNESRKTVAEAVMAIDRRTARMEDFFFGPPGQEYNGWIARTDRRVEDLDHPQVGRVAKVEKRLLLWAGGLTVLIPTAVWALNHLGK